MQNLIAFITFLLGIGPTIQSRLMKSYVCCHLLSREMSVRKLHSWGKKSLTIKLQNKHKKCKTVLWWIYTDTSMLSKIDFSLSSVFPLLLLSVCACVPVHECVSIAKNINFTNISPRLLNTSNPLCCALSCYGG